MGIRITRLLGIWALTATVLLIGFPRPASACTCQAALPSEMIDEADMVFIGSATDSQPAFSGSTIETLFAVESVIKGDVGADIVLSSHVDSGCGVFPTDGTAIGVAAAKVSGDVLREVCNVIDAPQLLAAAEGLGIEITHPSPPPQMAELPESTTTYAAAIPLSIGLSLVFLAAVALGTRTSSLSR